GVCDGDVEPRVGAAGGEGELRGDLAQVAADPEVAQVDARLLGGDHERARALRRVGVGPREHVLRAAAGDDGAHGAVEAEVHAPGLEQAQVGELKHPHRVGDVVALVAVPGGRVEQ